MMLRKVTVGLYVLLAAMIIANVLLVRQNLAMRQAIKVTQPGRLKVGDKVSPFTATGLNGETVSVTYTGKGREKVLLFFTPNCPFCRQQFPDWLEFAEQVNDKFEVIGLVGATEDKLKVHDFLRDMSFAADSQVTLRVAMVANEVRRNYKLSETPITLLVANDGTVKEVWVGKWSEDVLASVNKVFGITND